MSANTFAPVYQPDNGKLLQPLDHGEHIAVIGAGAFGGWTALWLLRKGFKVTLIDSWGPGNSRSSSGDETRVIRSTYGANRLYFDMNEQAYAHWLQHESRVGRKLLYNTGVLWLCYTPDTPLVDDSIPFAREHGRKFQYLDSAELTKHYRVLGTTGLHHGWFDPKGGYLLAREATASVCEQFIQEGGTFLRTEAIPGHYHSGRLSELELSKGYALKANAFVFACGAWLGNIFPELNNWITCTRQEVFYFGVPAQHTDAFESFPVWIDVDGKDFYYGIPANRYRGFKIGVDIRGPQFDPSADNRLPDPDVLQGVRHFLSIRFPLLANAPLLESRVCPYENSPDGNFLLDQHPAWENVLLLGGGSGHGFKHAPVVGELAADVLAGQRAIPQCFLLKNRV
ncbi:MAG: FAD-dependent oxidoreductase [Cyclobacteriaceae bacterium]|nr:FAD-dependent oxidoreductase [Cyclobacteriaceae bacterium]MDW8330127.1 FAD-dependent oxidoreductase [Cyclobacteriaceae bacterium]